MQKIRHVILVCCLLLMSVQMLAQYPLLRHFTTDDGLPSSTVYTMLQDKDGFIWLGTDVGVSRFDGKKFQNFSLSDGLSDNFIISIRTDSKGRVWFMGFNGTVSYWLDGKIFNAATDTVLRHIITSTSFVDFFEDAGNRLWFISQNEYLILDHDKIWKPDSGMVLAQGFVLNIKAGQLVINQNGSSLNPYGSSRFLPLNLKYKTRMAGSYTRLGEGNALFLSKQGIVKQTDTAQKLLVKFNGEFENASQPGIILSSDSLVWVSNIGLGVYSYDLKKNFAKPLIFLKNKMTAALLSDREGNIWISTLNEGLYMIPEWGRRVNIFNKENGLMDNACYAIHAADNGEILMGMNAGTQVVRNGKCYDLQMPKIEDGPNKVNHIIMNGDDVWIGTDKGVLHRNNKTRCNHYLYFKTTDTSDRKRISSIKYITIGKEEIFIVSGFNIIAYPRRCTGENGYILKYVNEKQTRTYSAFCDKSGELWFGTKSGLQSIRGKEYFDHSTENTLLTSGIYSIAETDDSVLVLATYGYGVVFYKKGEILDQITTASGLGSDICRRVFVYKNQVFVATPSGVSVISFHAGGSKSVTNMNTGNFLPSNDVNDIFANDSDIYVATIEGAAVLGRRTLEKIKPDIPLLHLTDVKVNDSSVSLNGEFKFSYQQNAFKFYYTGIYYQMPGEVNYRYRIKDDQPWQFTRNTTLEFSYLLPGEYSFQIQARIQNGEWSPLKKFNFKINAPFWNEVWFILLVIIVISSTTYFIVKQRLKVLRTRKEEKAKMERQITQLEQQALQTLMNPHFIFNVMNSIQHFINASDKIAANRYLADFAKLIRINLNISLKRFIPLEEEISYLQLYLSFEKLRFGDNLTYEIKVDPEIDMSETTIAVMMIQPFVENAIWHGILPTNAKGIITISMIMESEDLLKIIVEDNGAGIKELYMEENVANQLDDKHAMSMTMQRLHLLGKSSGHKLYMHYKHVHPEQTNKGTRVEFLLPANFH